MDHQTQSFVFDCPSRRGLPSLKIIAKRHRPPAGGISPVDGLTILFFHCLGGHKEQWEPVIEYLFSKSKSSFGRGHNKIREAWAFDCPSHGEAGVLNKEALLVEERKDFSLYDWVLGVVQFIRSDHMRGHRIVLCAHSSSTAVAALAAAEFYPNLGSAGITSLILVESTMLSREFMDANFEERMSSFSSSKSAVLIRKDTWKSRQDALSYFQKRYPWNLWDPKMLYLYVEHGLYELDDGTVTLACNRIREAEGFLDLDPQFEGAAGLDKLCPAVPIHTIWGMKQDVIPKYMQDALGDASKGRTFASVTRVERSAHFVLQERPIAVAQALCDILGIVPSNSVAPERSRL